MGETPKVERSATRRDSGVAAYVAYRDAEHIENPAVHAAYDRLGARFSAITQLLRARTRAGVSQQGLAEAMGTTRSAVSRLESGKHSPSVDTLSDAAAALGYELQIKFVKRRRG
ncbi:MAG: helix-turn-helix transcriptional regulator [Dehalococcoidia bacterium]